MRIPRNENDARSGDPEVGVVQMLGLWETERPQQLVRYARQSRRNN